ncbi:UBC-like protein [Polychaeton citri CBS 116435]|uniref:Ubiquitin-conjugating enzyme E2 Z n=1 Tax=Polychaeton citri CBS 116435 TaxID=1314669 RepID=A0A9P4UP50_9PEZI|nr:UBC-like protein [Polychaeton citri CBS 116435]
MANVNVNIAIQRVTGELARAQKNDDLSIAVAFRDDDVRSVRALIIGPPETPYEFGFFEFELRFPKDYPLKSPVVRALTTNGGRTRFNPNIYSEGKVCLSILGTWRGEPGEEWSSAQGLESVLLSIQSLMSPNPYENEPGHEYARKSDKAPTEYIRKIRHETIRVSVLRRLEQLLKVDPNKCAEGIVIDDRSSKRLKTMKMDESLRPDSPMQAAHSLAAPEIHGASKSSSSSSATPVIASGTSTPATSVDAYEYDAEAAYHALDPSPWKPFADLFKRRFLWYYTTYLSTIEAAQQEQKDGKMFELTDFESQSNGMTGSYQFSNLHSRLRNVKAALEAEKDAWVEQGLTYVAASRTLATQLAFQFQQLKCECDDSTRPGSRLDLSLPDPTNPFLWHITLFGQSEHNLDEGIFFITLHIPPTFPQDAQPRVTFQTRIFHHRVCPDTGALCYFPKNEESLASHLQAIVEAVEDVNPRFDPRASVHPEAGRLRWGSEEDQKLYKRKLRRSAQASVEA